MNIQLGTMRDFCTIVLFDLDIPIAINTFLGGGKGASVILPLL